MDIDILKFIVTPLNKEGDGDVIRDYYKVTTNIPAGTDEKSFRAVAADIMKAYLFADRAYFKTVEVEQSLYSGTWVFTAEITTFGGALGTKYSKTINKDAWSVEYDKSVVVHTERLADMVEKREFFRHRWFNGGAEEWFARNEG